MTEAWDDTIALLAADLGAPEAGRRRHGSNIAAMDRPGRLVFVIAVGDYAIVRCDSSLLPEVEVLVGGGERGATEVIGLLESRAQRVESGVVRLLPGTIDHARGERAVVVPPGDARLTEALAGLVAEVKPEEAREAEVDVDKQPEIAACILDGDRMVAYADAPPWRWSAKYADIGVLSDPAYRGRGHAVAVAARVARMAAEVGSIPVYLHAGWNDSSRRVGEKLGFLVASEISVYELRAPESDGR